MNNNYVSLYSDAQRYDLVMGAYSSGEQLDFYLRQVARFGEPVLELACGSGRFTIPLAKEGVTITGLDISEDMLGLAKSKASKDEVKVRLLQGDMRSFDLGEKYKLSSLQCSLCQISIHVKKLRNASHPFDGI